MKYIIYCRKSTESEDRQMLSLDSQENELKIIAEKQGLSILEILRESMSAKEPGRPVFNKMIKMINTGKADAILCWKIDRLTRNPVDGGQIQWLLQTGKIKCIQTFEKSYFPNDNVLLMSIEQAMANQYIRDLSINVKRGNREKLARGEWPNHAPFGYLNDKATKTVVVDETKEKYVKRVFQLRLKNKGLREISDILYSEGLRTNSGGKVYVNQIQRIIRNPFYTAIMFREGKYYPGKFKPIISQNIFDQAQEISVNRSRPKSKTLLFPLRGFMKCENCGCALTASLKKGHHYYYCTNGKQKCDEHKSYLRENYLYGEIARLLGSLAFTERKIEMMYGAVQERKKPDNDYAENIVITLQNELKALITKESKLLDAFLGEQITKEVYDQKVLEIQNQKTVVNKQIKETESKKPAFTLEPTKKAFLQGNKARIEFFEGDDIKKQEILERVLSNLSVKNKNIVSYQFKSVFQILAKAPKNAPISELLTDLSWNGAPPSPTISVL
jgi:DNA invertase Pin-like site-specific DNA recombinase